MNDAQMDFARYLARLLILRAVTLASFAGLIAYALASSTQQLNQPVLGILFLLTLLLSVPPAWALFRNQHITGEQMLSHIVVDIALLSVLLFYTGGYTNPMISLYLLPVLVAGLTMPRRHAWIIAGITIVAYTLLMRFYRPLFDMHAKGMLPHEFKLHLLGMWLTFVLSIVLMIGVVVRMSEQRRERERQLADMRQRSIREHAILALGAQAAFDAHELGTPINTLLLLVDEFAASTLGRKERRHLQTMRQQLLYCRNVLNRLSKRARELSAGAASHIAVLEMVERAVKQWRNLHPGIRVELQQEASKDIKANPMLEQVVFILLDNAADAGATQAQIVLSQHQGCAVLEVSDNGTGFIHSLLDILGTEPVTTKAHGKGLGLCLVRAVMEQMRGEVHFANRPQGGAKVVLQWPVAMQPKQEEIES